MSNSKSLKQRMTALALASTLFLSACASEENNDRFEFIENENDQLVVMEDYYISNDIIHKFYVLEVCNRITKENELYIVRFDGVMVGYIGHYTDVFTNVEFSVGYVDSLFDCVNITPLSGYLVSYNLVQLQYSYEDMKEIYEAIKENYVFEDDSSLSKKRVKNFRI